MNRHSCWIVQPRWWNWTKRCNSIHCVVYICMEWCLFMASTKMHRLLLIVKLTWIVFTEVHVAKAFMFLQFISYVFVDFVLVPDVEAMFLKDSDVILQLTNQFLNGTLHLNFVCDVYGFRLRFRCSIISWYFFGNPLFVCDVHTYLFVFTIWILTFLTFTLMASIIGTFPRCWTADYLRNQFIKITWWNYILFL